MLIIPPIRGQDSQGNGAFQAPRVKYIDGVKKEYLHKGEDFLCYPESKIINFRSGVVSKIGFPYRQHGLKTGKDKLKAEFRYIEITDNDGVRVRYMYVQPFLSVGSEIEAGVILGVSQDLTKPFKGIGNHIHIECHDGNHLIRPTEYIGELI